MKTRTSELFRMIAQAHRTIAKNAGPLMKKVYTDIADSMENDAAIEEAQEVLESPIDKN